MVFGEGLNMIDLDKLPWIQIEDTEAAYYAMPYLGVAPIILEAGACSGDDTQLFKKIWSYCTIHAFEPHEVHYAELSRRVKIMKDNGINNINLYNFALSDTDGEKTFYMSDDVPAASSLLSDNYSNIEIPQTILDSVNLKREDISYRDKPTTVKCMRMSSWARMMNVTKIDYMWLDAEGAELIILQNAGHIIDNVKVINTEVNFLEFRKGTVQFEELYNFLIEKGFTIQYIWGNRIWQGNAIFIKN